jgi:hypothetical protein
MLFLLEIPRENLVLMGNQHKMAFQDYRVLKVTTLNNK